MTTETSQKIDTLRKRGGLFPSDLVLALRPWRSARGSAHQARRWTAFLHVERAELAGLTSDEAAYQRELREAYRLFLEIGAPIRAAEIAEELRSGAA